MDWSDFSFHTGLTRLGFSMGWTREVDTVTDGDILSEEGKILGRDAALAEGDDDLTRILENQHDHLVVIKGEEDRLWVVGVDEFGGPFEVGEHAKIFYRPIEDVVKDYIPPDFVSKQEIERTTRGYELLKIQLI